jgi:hypothetical protein
MCAFYPATDGLPGLADIDVDGYLGRFRRESGGLIWLGVVLGSVLFALSPLITIGVPLPSFLLRAGTLDRYADRVAQHPVYLIRQTILLVKSMAGMHWGAHATVREQFSLPAYPADPGTWRIT